MSSTERTSVRPRRRRARGAAFVLTLGLVLAALGCTSLGESTVTATGTATTAPDTTVPPGSAITTVGPSSTGTSAPTTKPTARSTTTRRTSTTKPTEGGGLPGKEYSRVPGTAKVVALTFDAAYDPTPLAGILATLTSERVPATFFLTGEFIRDFPKPVAAIVAGGYPIGNHSYSHPDFATLDAAAIESQLTRTSALIRQAGAADPRPLFRPPFGSRDARILSILADQGYVSVYWTIDTLDWKTDRSGAQIRQAVLDKLQPGAIILMHVGGKATAGILPTLIHDLRARGYGFVDLRTALGNQ